MSDLNMIICPICRESCYEGTSTKGRTRGEVVCENEDYIHNVTKSGMNILTRTDQNILAEMQETFYQTFK